MKRFIRFASLYNLGATVLLMFPVLYSLVGLPLEPVAAKLSGCLLLFTVPVLWFASNDLERLGSLAYWDGVTRILVFFSFLYHGINVWGFAGTGLAVADLVIGIAIIVGVAKSLDRSHAALLLARTAA